MPAMLTFADVFRDGNHKNLMSKKGQYYRMVTSQMGELGFDL